MVRVHQDGGTRIRSSSSDICVIFIHGILSNGEQAWMNGAVTTWPRLLAKDDSLSSVGIYEFSYRSDAFSRTYNLGDVVDSLREFFDLDALWSTKRLIFVCHSMGGIAVRRFIVVNQAKFIDRGTEIGLFLVASPSLGPKDENALHFLARLARNAQADLLRFSQTNTWLNDLDKEFLTLKENRKIHIVGKELIEDETIKIKKLLGLNTKIVEPFSAARYFGDPYKVPYSDHVNIAKPADNDAIQHRLLVRFIKNKMYPEMAGSGVESITDEGRVDAKKALLALNDRVDKGKLGNKTALAALSEALISRIKTMGPRGT